MTSPPTLADLMADPGELDVSCLEECHHNTTMPVAALLPRYAPDTPFPEVRGGFRCSACGSKRVDVRPNWAARQAVRADIPAIVARPADHRVGTGAPAVVVAAGRAVVRVSYLSGV
jgi:hypothetical protein